MMRGTPGPADKAYQAGQGARRPYFYREVTPATENLAQKIWRPQPLDSFRDFFRISLTSFQKAVAERFIPLTSASDVTRVQDTTRECSQPAE